MIESIIKIIAPWIVKENEQKKSDEEKFLELLNILKPEEVNLWCDDLWNALYRINKNRPMDNYFIFIELPSSYFFRKKIIQDYKSFNGKFSKLRTFLITHFFVNTNNTDFVQLYPELKETNPILYSQRLEELRVLVSQFQNEYNKLVISGREKYVGTFTAVISLLLLATVVTPGIIYTIQKAFLYFKF